MPRSAFKFECIACGGEMELNKQYGKIQCLECGRFLDGSYPDPADDTPEEADDAPQAEKERWVLGGLIFAGKLEPWMRTLVESLRSQLNLGQRQEALNTCYRLLEMERDFIDANLWIARLSGDDDEKRQHLERALALAPGNAEAARMLLVLNGEMTEEEATRSEDLYHDNRQTADGAVEAASDALLCPLCRGTLTVSDNGSVTCAFCGFEDKDATNAVKPTKTSSLAVSLIKQRGQAIRWQVGERMIHCNECGAERVLPPGKMTSRCAFCNSKHVVVQDTLGAFRQPDGLVRFRVNRKQAEQIVNEQLGSRVEKLKGIFTENRIDRTSYQGVFLPYWVFDVYGTLLITDSYNDKDGKPRTERLDIVDQMRHVSIPGVESPPRPMLKGLGDFDYSEMISYTPKLLAKFAAELYHHDFDAASMEARGMFREVMVGKHRSLNPNRRRTIMSRVDYMDMRLMLLPVWVVTLIEKDDDVRTALVNGQTGQAVLGKAMKPTP